MRHQYRDARQCLSWREQARAAQKLERIITTRAEFRRARRIAVYIASNGEINTDAIIKRAWAMGKEVYLPTVPTRGTMQLIRYRNGEPLVTGPWQLQQPRHGTAVAAETLDLILMPLVAFDRHGHRLGRGGGFYDRYLARRRRDNRRKKPLLCGLAHHIQQADNLPAQQWDIAMDAVASDREFIDCRRQILSNHR